MQVNNQSVRGAARPQYNVACIGPTGDPHDSDNMFLVLMLPTKLGCPVDVIIRAAAVTFIGRPVYVHAGVGCTSSGWRFMYFSRSVSGCMRVGTDWGVVRSQEEGENNDWPERDEVTSLKVLGDVVYAVERS
jgi:hypothetical protein